MIERQKVGERESERGRESLREIERDLEGLGSE